MRFIKFITPYFFILTVKNEQVINQLDINNRHRDLKC